MINHPPRRFTHRTARYRRPARITLLSLRGRGKARKADYRTDCEQPQIKRNNQGTRRRQQRNSLRQSQVRKGLILV